MYEDVRCHVILWNLICPNWNFKEAVNISHHIITFELSTKPFRKLAPSLPAFQLGFPCCRSMPHGSRVVVLSDDPSLAISWGLQFRTYVTPASFGICWMAIAHCDTLTHWYRWISVCPMQDLIQKETCVRCSHHDLQIHCRYGRIVQWRNRVPETSVWLWYVVVSAYHANKFMNAVHR